ncbi:MAG: polyprenyl synthetase family protein [Candidatus Micrarchaeaceae archaeon]
MNFKEYIELNRNSIYSAIMGYLPLKEPVEHYKVVRDYSERMGSYRRPGLLMLCGEMFGATREELLLPAAAMQMSEDWILIHDDIEDDSEMRRGKPALHKLYGQAIALNAGDAAHIAMWFMLKDYIAKAGLAKGLALFDKFYDMLRFTVEGQYLDINFMRTHEMASATESMYNRIVESKTCYYTVYGPMQLGALIAGRPESDLNMLKEIGEPAGIAFQLVDDILDMTADEKAFGKKRYGDLYEGKLTLIMLHTYKKANAEEKGRIDKIYAKSRHQKSEDEIEFLVKMVEKYKGIEYAQKIAEKYGRQAKSTIDKYRSRLPQNDYTKIMLSAMEELYVRKV